MIGEVHDIPGAAVLVAVGADQHRFEIGRPILETDVEVGKGLFDLGYRLLPGRIHKMQLAGIGAAIAYVAAGTRIRVKPVYALFGQELFRGTTDQRNLIPVSGPFFVIGSIYHAFSVRPESDEPDPAHALAIPMRDLAFRKGPVALAEKLPGVVQVRVVEVRLHVSGFVHEPAAPVVFAR